MFEYLSVIIVHGQTSVPQAVRDEFVASARRSVPLTRLEVGNVGYVISTDILDPESFHLLEIWESSQALRSHSLAAHQHVRIRELGELGVSWQNIRSYTADPLRATE